MVKPVTVDDIKSFINDYKDSNRLQKESEFSPERIQKGISHIVAEWNETPPLTSNYTEETFPYRNVLIYGVVSWLYMGQSIHQERNHLVYQSGGLTVDDDNNAQAYLNFSNLCYAKYKEAMEKQKVMENINGGWGTLSSDYYSPYFN